MLGTTELVVILFIVVLVFGAKKIPELGDALGKGIRNFRKSTLDDDAPRRKVASQTGEDA